MAEGHGRCLPRSGLRAPPPGHLSRHAQADLEQSPIRAATATWRSHARVFRLRLDNGRFSPAPTPRGRTEFTTPRHGQQSSTAGTRYVRGLTCAERAESLHCMQARASRRAPSRSGTLNQTAVFIANRYLERQYSMSNSACTLVWHDTSPR